MGAWDALAGMLLALLGSYVFLAARTFPNLSGGYPGPGLFPQLLGILLACAGAGLVLNSLPAGRRLGRSAPVGASRRDTVAALIVVLAVVVFIVLVDRVGFVPLAFLILAGLMLTLGVPARWSVPLGVALTLLLYLLFARLLRVPLPSGLLP